MKKLLNKKGFTLIELLIVIAIIGILAVAFLPSLLGAPSKGRDTQRIADVQKISNFFSSESLANATLPATGCVKKSLAGGAGATAVSTYISGKLADFSGVFPQDPTSDNTIAGACATAGSYGYIKYAAVGHKYTFGVYAHLENKASANVKCASATDVVDPALNIGEAIGADDAGCYLVLFQ